MICEKCGAELKENQLVCPKCGNDVLEDEPLEARAAVVDKKKKLIQEEALEAIQNIEEMLADLKPELSVKREEIAPAEEVKDQRLSDRKKEYREEAERIIRAAGMGPAGEEPADREPDRDHESDPENGAENGAEDGGRAFPPEEEEKRSGGIKRFIVGLITLLFIVAAVGLLILTFFKDTPVGRTLDSMIGRVTGRVETLEEGENDASVEVSSEEEGTSDTAEAASEDGTGLIGSAILEKMDNAAGIGEVKEGKDLKFEIEKDYGVQGITKAISFDDDIWYISDATESIHYTPELVGFVMDFYSKYYDRLNNDGEEVLDLIVAGSKLEGDVSAIKSDPIVIHNLNKLEIGEIRRLNSDFYMMVRLRETTNDGNAPTTVTKVLRMTASNEKIEMAEIVDAI